MEICSKMTGLEALDGAFLIHTDAADIKIIFLTDEIIRIRASFDREFAEESYVLMATAWEDRLDPLFEGERTRLVPVWPELHETEAALVFSTDALRLVLDRDPLCISLFDAEGAELYRSVAGNPFVLDSNRRVTHYSRMEDGDCFYGFGEKTGRLNKNGALIRERATDAMGYDPQACDTLYKHVPFYIHLRRNTRKAVGLFYHNFYESVFNMGREKSNYWPRYSYWQADGGDIDFFLLGGGTIPRILDHYTFLTGRPALLPKRALGYQGSSMYYPELEKDCDRAVLGFVDTAREEGFPLDGFHLSSGYTARNGKRYVFTWNRERFPDPEDWFHAMNARAAQVVPNVKPGILTDHPDFADFQAQQVFVRDSRDPSRPAVGRWWGGPGAYWDFTSPSAREVWKRYLTGRLIALGTDSVWNDNCEYDGLLDKDARVDFDGKGAALGGLRPLMANLMCRCARDAVEDHNPDARPYIVCRGGAAGIQRYAQTWCGDNRTGWDTLRWNIPTLLGMGLSGQPNEGADIGGFAGPAPDEELFVRWVQNGIFQPRFSIHSASDDNTVTEPWMFSGSTGFIRGAMLFRYRLTPYLYSAEYEASQTGMPIMRAPVCDFQDDENCWNESFEFLFGRDLLVANVLEPGAESRSVYLPKGAKWYAWHDRYRCFEGGQTVEVPVTLGSFPLFIREGAVIPLADSPVLSMERSRVTDLRLLLVPGGPERCYTLYDDDGVSNDYRNGGYRKTEITMSGSPDRAVTVGFRPEGNWPDTVEHVTVEMICRERSPLRVTLGDQVLERFLNRSRFESAGIGWYYSQTNRAVLIRYPNPDGEYSLTVSFEPQDLIGM